MFFSILSSFITFLLIYTSEICKIIYDEKYHSSTTLFKLTPVKFHLRVLGLVLWKSFNSPLLIFSISFTNVSIYTCSSSVTLFLGWRVLACWTSLWKLVILIMFITFLCILQNSSVPLLQYHGQNSCLEE